MPGVPLLLPTGEDQHGGSMPANSRQTLSGQPPASEGRNVMPANLSTDQISQPRQADSDVIDLLDDDDDNEEIGGDSNGNPSNKRARLSPNGDNPHSAAAMKAHLERNANMPLWMTQRRPGQGNPVPIPGQVSSTTNSLSSADTAAMIQKMYQNKAQQGQQQQQATQPKIHVPHYIPLPPEFTPRWERFIPKPKRNVFRRFELSLLNMQEFTITGLPVSYDGALSSVAGLRSDIKRISKQCGGKAVYDRNAEMRDENGDEMDGNNNTVSPEEGRWRIPLVRSCNFLVPFSTKALTVVPSLILFFHFPAINENPILRAD